MPNLTHLNLNIDILSHSNTVTYTSWRQLRAIKMLTNILVMKKKLNVTMREFNQKQGS